MRHSRFEEIFREMLVDMENLLVVKGGEYSPGEDRLGHFKKTAERLMLSPLEVWAVYADKHQDAIENFILDYVGGVSRPQSESIRGRALDLMNYLILFVALVEDLETKPDDPIRRLIWEEEHK